jgi:hypothetical protein
LLNHPSSNPPAPPQGRLAAVARVVRQVCLLREQGETLRATHVQEHELADAVREFRLRLGPEALPESELRGLFAVEEQRVAEAAILSELLLPRLVDALPVHAGRARSLPPPARDEPSPPPRKPEPAAGPPAIPDLLDAMLAAERHGRRPAPANPREP